MAEWEREAHFAWKAKEKRDEKLKEVQKIRDYIEGMKRDNEKRQNQIDNEIDVNPETVCKPIGVEAWSAGKQSGTRPKYSDECLRHRRAINMIRGRIGKNLEMIKIQEAKLIKKQKILPSKPLISEKQWDFLSNSSIGKYIVREDFEIKQQEVITKHEEQYKKEESLKEPKTLQERGGFEIRGVPKSGSITFSGISENSVLVSWNFNQGDSPITSYHLVIKDEDTRQTKYETSFYVGGGDIVPTSTLISNLDSGTNYTAFIIATNEIGNSIETSKGFKTKRVTISTAKKGENVFGVGVDKETEDTTDSGFDPTSTPPPDTKKGENVFGVGVDKETEDTTDSGFDPEIIPSTPEVYADTPDITISPEVQAILTKFDNNDYDYPYTDLLGVMNQVKDGTLSNKKFLDIMNYLLEHGTIIDKTALPPVIDYNIDNSMVTQTILPFTLENGKLKGSIKYIANDSFNPTYFGENQLISFVKVYDESNNLIPIDYKKEEGKDNPLYFTNTERDELINIDETVGDTNIVKVEFYVWNNELNRVEFSKMKKDSYVAKEVGLPPCVIGQHRDSSGKCVPDNKEEVTTSLLGKFMGVTAILGTLALLGSKGR